MAISISKPVVGGSENTWGDTINTGLTAVESTLNGSGTGKATVAPDLSTLTINAVNVTATGAELNMVDGDTAATATTVVGADRVVYNDNGTMKQVSMTDINTFIQSQSGTAGDGTITVTGAGALNGSGSFTVNQAGNTSITLNHDTSSQGSSNNSGNTFIQDITLDSYGHITGIGTATASSGPSTSGTTVGTLTSPSSATVSIAAGKYFHLVQTGTALTYTATVSGGGFVNFGTGAIQTSGNFSVGGGQTSPVCFTASGVTFQTTGGTNSGVGAIYQTL